MTLPSGSQNFEVIIDLLTKGGDEAVKQVKDTEAKISNETKEQRIFRQREREKEAKRRVDESAQVTKKIVDDLKAQEKADEALAKQVIKNNQLQIRELRARAAEITKTAATLKSSAGDIDRFAKPLATGGLFVVGGIFAAASKYVNDAEKATATTVAWKRAQDDLNRSGSRIGEILATEALPIIKEAAVVAQKIASILEAHPEIVGAALKAGGIALTLGTLGKAVSSGIRLYADLKMDTALGLQLTAAELQLKAAQAQLEAAGIQSAGGGITKGAGGIAGAIASPGGSVALIAGAVALANFTDNQLTKFEEVLIKSGEAGQKIAPIFDVLSRTIIGINSPLLSVVHNFKVAKDGITKLFGGGADKSIAAPIAPTFLGGTEDTQNQLLAAYEKYKQEDLALVQKHYDERNSIISDALKAVSAENSQYAANVTKINSSINAQITKVGQDYRANEIKAEQDYAQNRSDIIKSGHDDILKLEEDSRERIKKLRQAFEDKAANATNRRDALGLLDARRDFDRASAEEVANTKKEIARRRADIAQRLQELDTQFAAEKQHRLEDYQARVKELNDQRAEQLKEASIAHQEALKQIKAQEAEKLKAADEAFRIEQKHKRDALLAQIRDVDAALLGQENLTKQYHARMLTELEQFLQSQSALFGGLTGAAALGTASGGVAPTTSGGGTASSTWSLAGLFGTNHDTGGYTPKGIYRMAWDGNTEFTLSGASTKAMERIVGGQLTQQNIMQAAGRGGGGNATLNYNARFDGEVTSAMRRAVHGDIQKALSDFVKGAL